MSKTIIQDVLFKNTTPKELYDIYTDGKKHSIATGAPAEINPTEGSSYSAHSGYITGKNLQLIPDRLIVQSWRAQSWDAGDIDSTFIIHLESIGSDVMLHAIHANVPDNAYDDLDAGWKKMYWEPFRLYLAGTPIDKASM
ncbi:SRPBCC domain-containing protein [Chitinophaga sp. HK235]|uniref:SRPBCC domain-containing protein n=1 Tax=Chitinophaga sp. HK235 TaxID=2952571 RepID=UPI001BA631A9|nr:SRPBCC domain-containing protein [Chitinophaga sp. HK235]